MGRSLNRLSARTVASLTEPGRHADGGGLYASIGKGDVAKGGGGSRRWVFLYRWEGARHEMGLGSLDAVPLAKARELAAKCRLAIAEGRNPLAERREADAALRRASAPSSFGEVADALIAGREAGWRNAKHRAQWRMTLTVYAAPLRAKPVASITTEDVLAVLTPIWMEKPETAGRVRGRIETVLDAARARGLIEHGVANPARWRGHLDHLLPRRSRLSRGHHTALPWQDLPAFMAELRGRPAVAARALEWCILTGARSGEALGARWAEIDRGARLWTVPAERMKAGKAHRVPLSSAAIAVLDAMTAGEPGALVFPGARRGKPLSNMAFKALYLRMGRPTLTTHGFRSTFRDWAGEATPHPRDVCEAALAHAVGDAVEQAYRRGDALEKRRALMNDWAGYCLGAEPANVVPMRRAR